jgi:hypothetical protein
MTTTHPPVVAEAILESFGADHEFRDAILGDLAQEHAQRVEQYGARPARLWYYRQAVLAMPALLRNWLSGAKWRDARRLLNVAALSYVLTMMIQVAIFFVSALIMPLFTSPRIPGTMAGQLTLGLAISIFGPACGGFVAAGLEEERPMIGAAAVGFAWTAFLLTGMIISVLFLPVQAGFNQGFFVAMRLAIIPVVVCCSLIGGALRVWVASGRQAAPA